MKCESVIFVSLYMYTVLLEETNVAGPSITQGGWDSINLAGESILYPCDDNVPCLSYSNQGWQLTKTHLNFNDNKSMKFGPYYSNSIGEFDEAPPKYIFQVQVSLVISGRQKAQ